MGMKFRVWCEFEIEGKLYKEMAGPENWFLLTQAGKLMSHGPMSFDPNAEQKHKKLIPLFHTGLKDKNGKEDYAGDIWEVEYQGKKHRFLRQVTTTWQGYEFAFKCITGEISPVHANVDEDGIIIGNRYENPELIKRKS